MRFRQIILCVFCVAAAAGLLFWGSLRLDEINIQRGQMKLVMNEPLENAPPSLAFATVALGAFRGLIVDVLWIRAEQMKEDGKFFDARQLAEWITLLQPRFAAVWDFHAWNMAYNISVTIPASRPQERWHWVKNGYELLRDKGIEKNPNNIELYRSLGLIFQHKIGNIMDDCHKYYKLRLYHSIKPLIGPATQEYYLKLAQAPKKLEDMLTNPETVKFLNELSAADSTFANRQEFVNNYLALRRQPSRFPDKDLYIINSYKGTQTLEDFDIFANAYYLRNTWKLEPEFMAQLNEEYGPIDFKDPNKVLPLDWTLADVHAVYWAALGLKNAAGGKYSFEELNTDRIVFHSLQNLYTRGKMIVYTSKTPSPSDPCEIIEREGVFLSPDLRMFTRYDQALRAIMAKYEEYGTDPNILSVPHRNMLKRSVLLFYQAGHIAHASEAYNTLRKEYPTDSEVKESSSVTEFARNRLINELQLLGYSDAVEIITLMLQDAYYRYAVYDDDETFGREKMAREVYDFFQQSQGIEDAERIGLPDFDIIRYAGLNSFMNDPRYPDDLRRNLINRIHIERPELYEKIKKQQEDILQQMQQQESIQQ